MVNDNTYTKDVYDNLANWIIIKSINSFVRALYFIFDLYSAKVLVLWK